jgi:hypothetical protein
MQCTVFDIPVIIFQPQYDLLCKCNSCSINFNKIHLNSRKHEYHFDWFSTGFPDCTHISESTGKERVWNTSYN